MNLDDVLDRDIFEQKTAPYRKLSRRIGMLLNHLLSIAGVFLFWVFMIALLTSPAWAPALVDAVWIHLIP